MDASSPPLTAAIVTPSFRGDLAQCRLLVDSVHRYVPPEVAHVIVVGRRDFALFAPLRSARTIVLCVEDILTPRIRRIPLTKQLWLSARLRPVRGWIVQQIVKLSMASAVPADLLVFADSDVFFVRPYDPRSLVRDGRTPLFREYGEQVRGDFNDRWHGISAQLLGLDPHARHLTSYVGQLITWRAENLRSLRTHVERCTGRPFFEAVAGAPTLSEYVLYGMYCEHVLADCKQYHVQTINTLNYWPDRALDRGGLVTLRQQLAPEHVAVMISAKSRTPATLIRQVFTDDSPVTGAA